jgi:hypothetical protein
MQEIDQKLKLFRTTIRQNSKRIIDSIINDFVIRENGKAKSVNHFDICMFCGSSQKITKEHVIPRWLINGDTRRKFATNINGISQTYNKTTIPACSTCNTDLLNSIEKYVNRLFTKTDLKKSFFETQEIDNIIRWLEIIEYKFQVLNIRRKFITPKGNDFILYLADFPISMLRSNKDYSPSKVVFEIRQSLKRLSIKRKNQATNSLIVLKTSNHSFHFFHTMNEFIFIELPVHNIAIFYFFNKKFETAKEGYIEAMKTIEAVY